METKLLYAENPRASSPNNICISWEIYTAYEIGYLMDRILELKSSTESIKKTMLMHEDIFKQQTFNQDLKRDANRKRLERSTSMADIRIFNITLFKQLFKIIEVKELHRLYNIQRKLMLDLKNEMSKTEDPIVLLLHKSMINNTINNTPQNLSTWQQPRRERELNSSNILVDDQQRERSGSSSGENSKILIPIRGLNLEMPADKEGTSTSKYEHEKSKMRNIHRCDEETDVELTLSIGPSNSKKRLKSHMHKEKELSFSTSAKFEECGDGSPAAMSSSTTFNKESATQAFWFFQDLSLNRR